MEFLRICYQVSTRRAIQTLAAPRATFYYRSRQPEQAPLRYRIKEIAAVRPCCSGRAGRSITNGFIGFIVWKGCRCAISRPGAG